MVKKIFLFCVIIFFCIIFLTACSINDEEKPSIESKITEEIEYIENKILTFLNMYAKDEYDLEEDLNWNLIEENAIDLNGILDTIILDMTEVEISNETIIEFKNRVNNLSIAISNKDIDATLEEYRLLYLLLPIYAEKIYSNKNELEILRLKSLAVSSYVLANRSEWEEAKKTILETENKYKTMMDNVDYIKEYSYNLNKVFVLIGELRNAIELEELELTNIKYVNFIEKI